MAAFGHASSHLVKNAAAYRRQNGFHDRRFLEPTHIDVDVQRLIEVECDNAVLGTQ
jgi:hypothetical protein